MNVFLPRRDREKLNLRHWVCILTTMSRGEYRVLNRELKHKRYNQYLERARVDYKSYLVLDYCGDRCGFDSTKALMAAGVPLRRIVAISREFSAEPSRRTILGESEHIRYARDTLGVKAVRSDLGDYVSGMRVPKSILVAADFMCGWKNALPTISRIVDLYRRGHCENIYILLNISTRDRLVSSKNPVPGGNKRGRTL